MHLCSKALRFVPVPVVEAIMRNFWQELRGFERDHLLERMGVKTRYCFVVSASICSYFSSGFGDSPPMFLCFQAGYVNWMVVVVDLRCKCSFNQQYSGPECSCTQAQRHSLARETAVRKHEPAGTEPMRGSALTVACGMLPFSHSMVRKFTSHFFWLACLDFLWHKWFTENLVTFCMIRKGTFSSSGQMVNSSCKPVTLLRCTADVLNLTPAWNASHCVPSQLGIVSGLPAEIGMASFFVEVELHFLRAHTGLRVWLLFRQMNSRPSRTYWECCIQRFECITSGVQYACSQLSEQYDLPQCLSG